MAEKRHFQWRNENGATRYPFTEAATLVNRDGRSLPVGVFLDAAIYPPDSIGNFYLSRVQATARSTRLTIGDGSDPALATGEFSTAAPPEEVSLIDGHGHPAGVLVSAPQRLVALVVLGDTRFQPDETPFCPSVCFPRPAAGVQGFLLPDGTVAAGEIWLVGGPGVVFSYAGAAAEAIGPLCGEDAVDVASVAVHVVGDPLFRRRLCTASGFTTPPFVRTVRFTDGTRTFECGPNDGGDIRLAVDDTEASKPTLRLAVRDGALFVSQIGDTN